jgi:hypothetical protein
MNPVKRPPVESHADGYWREKTACGRDCLGGLIALAVVLLAMSLF